MTDTDTTTGRWRTAREAALHRARPARPARAVEIRDIGDQP